MEKCMSLFNMLFGNGKPEVNKILGKVLDLDTAGGVWPTGRLRSIYANREGEELQIVLYTRNGGGNRDCWDPDEVQIEGDECECPGCVISNILPRHPDYLGDSDDDFDCTYASIVFSVPEQYIDVVEACLSDEPTPEEKWKQLFEVLGE